MLSSLLVFQATVELGKGGKEQNKLKCHKACLFLLSFSDFSWLNTLYIVASFCSISRTLKKIDFDSFSLLLRNRRLCSIISLPFSLLETLADIFCKCVVLRVFCSRTQFGRYFREHILAGVLSIFSSWHTLSPHSNLNVKSKFRWGILYLEILSGNLFYLESRLRQMWVFVAFAC